MVKEIYIRPKSDPMYTPGIIEYSNEIEAVISQIKMILGTKNGEVLGEYNFGLDLDYLVFNTRASAVKVRKDILDAISVYVKNKQNVDIDVEVNFGDSGEGYDYAVIDVILNGQKAIGFLIDKE